MNIVFLIIGILIGVIALLFIIAVFVKKEYSIQQEVTVNRKTLDVFDYIKISKNMDHYNKWWRLDPSAKKSYQGIDGTVGFIAAWDSANKQAGKGEQEIKSITDGERIEFEIRFEKPFEGVADSRMVIQDDNNQTKITWTFEGANKYPMNLMFTLLRLDKILGRDLSESLVMLKNVLEV
jgi:hypothetical protein